MAETPMDRSIGAAAHLASGPKRAPQTCRWGDATLFQPFPEWLSACDTPWTCHHPAHPGPLETVDTCTACRDWKSAKGSR